MQNNKLQAYHTHHHHHRHGARTFNERQTAAKKRRAILSKVLFATGCVIATAIVIAVFWLYTNE